MAKSKRRGLFFLETKSWKEYSYLKEILNCSKILLIYASPKDFKHPQLFVPPEFKSAAAQTFKFPQSHLQTQKIPEREVDISSFSAFLRTVKRPKR